MNHSAIVSRLGAPAIAARLGCHVSRPHRWRQDNRIPAERWAEVVELAAESGQPEITLELLAKGRRRRDAERGQAVAA